MCEKLSQYVDGGMRPEYKVERFRTGSVSPESVQYDEGSKKSGLTLPRVSSPAFQARLQVMLLAG